MTLPVMLIERSLSSTSQFAFRNKVLISGDLAKLIQLVL